MVRTASAGVKAPATTQDEDTTSWQHDETSLSGNGNHRSVSAIGEVDRRGGANQRHHDRDESFLFSLVRARRPDLLRTAEDFGRGKIARRDGGRAERSSRTGQRYSPIFPEWNPTTYYYNYQSNKLLLLRQWKLDQCSQSDNRSPLAVAFAEVVDRA